MLLWLVLPAYLRYPKRLKQGSRYDVDDEV